MSKKKKSTKKKKDTLKTYRIGGSKVTEGAIAGGLSGLATGHLDAAQALKMTKKNPAWNAADKKFQKEFARYIKNSHLSSHMLRGLVLGGILGSFVPRTKRFTKKEVEAHRDKRRKERAIKYANLGGVTMDNTSQTKETLSKSELLWSELETSGELDKLAGLGKWKRTYERFKKWWKGTDDKVKNNKNKNKNPKDDKIVGPDGKPVQPEPAPSVIQKTKDKIKEKKWPLTVTAGTVVLSVATHEMVENQRVANASKNSAINNIYNKDEVDAIVDSGQFLDSLLVSNQKIGLESIKDPDERASVREGVDSYNKLNWYMSDPVWKDDYPHLKNHRQTLYDNGKLGPWEDNPAFVHPSMKQN